MFNVCHLLNPFKVTRGRGRNSIRRQKRSKGGEGGPNPSLAPEFSISLFGELSKVVGY